MEQLSDGGPPRYDLLYDLATADRDITRPRPAPTARRLAAAQKAVLDLSPETREGTLSRVVSTSGLSPEVHAWALAELAR